MNGHASSPRRVPSAGAWAPAVTFFTEETDELDLDSQAKYYYYLSQHLTGLVILGTNAETFLLTREERNALLQTARKAVGPDYEIMAGVSGHSTKQVLEFISDAAAASANYALVLPCAYFGKQTTPQVIHNFYSEIATKSPLPICIYNFPAVCNGVDLSSDTIASLHRQYPDKIVGVKLTCASVGKITRLAADFDRTRFAVFGGQSDFLLAGLAVGSAGSISAFANVAPRLIRRIYDLYSSGKHDEALTLQRVAAKAEIIGQSGIANTKYAASLTSARMAVGDGVEGKLAPRKPYESLSTDAKKIVRDRIEEVAKLESSF